MTEKRSFPTVSRIADHSGYNPRHTGGGGGEPPMNNIEARVEYLERDISDMKSTLARIETKLDAFATKAELASTETRIIKWNVGTILAAGGLVFAIMRFLPGS